MSKYVAIAKTFRYVISSDQHGLPGSRRIDLPIFEPSVLVENGSITTGSGTRFFYGDAQPPVSGEHVRRPRYRYVDTSFHATSHTDILYTDSMSICSGFGIWSQGHGGLAHIVPSSLAKRDAIAFLKGFGSRPREILIGTTESSAPPFGVTINPDENNCSLLAVVAALDDIYGESIKEIKITVVTGYDNKSWSAKSRIAVDPLSGPFMNI